MEKRTLIALALSFIVLGAYPMILSKFYPDYYYKKQPASAKKDRETASSKIAAPAPVRTFLKSGDFLNEHDLFFKNEKLNLVFNKKDGGIREVSFPSFMDSQTKKPLQFLSVKNTGVSPTSLVISSAGDVFAVTDYQIKQQGSELTFLASTLSDKLKIVKKMVFDQGYYANIELRFENTSNVNLDFQYDLIAGSGVAPRHSIDGQYIEGNFFSQQGERDKKILKHINETRVGKQVSSHGFVRWVAIKDRHFSAVLKPETHTAFSGVVHGLGNHDRSVSLLSSPIHMPAHGVQTDRFILYLGPNELEPLQKSGLEDLINFGKFDPIGRFFVGALELLQKIFKNYGISIIMLTVIINIFLFPLTRVSYMSMKRMQLIQPQMTKLREHHKTSPEKLNKEMMELYKKHKVNPFGGCLPMIVQLPIFVALYVALSKSVILINSKLFWINDLSSPDRVYLPFSLPFLGNNIHILPLLMVAAMALQQKFTQIKIEGQSTAMEQQQKMMTVMMPIIFGFIFYEMPSGLVLYWLTNTILMSLYQLKLKNMTLG